LRAQAYTSDPAELSMRRLEQGAHFGYQGDPQAPFDSLSGDCPRC
jgi:hypothetical protein